MRGYRFLKKTGQLGLIAQVHDGLVNTCFSEIDRNVSKFFFGAGAEKAELITRQYLLMRIGILGLNKALLFSLGGKNCPVVYPLPKAWQQVIIRHGFSVARIRCSLAWAGYVWLLWGYGILIVIKEFYTSICAMIQPYSLTLGRYAYFDGLASSNLPQPCRDGRSHDVVTWYSHWKGKAVHLDALCHGVANTKKCDVDGTPVLYTSYALPVLDTLGNVICYAVWAFVAVLRSVIDLLIGHWWHAILLAEFVTAARARFLAPKKLACDYLFHVSGWLYRPLWTYEAKNKGSRILFYLYSTNCENFKRPEGYPLQAASWRVVNWPTYLVWDEYQADFFRRVVNPSVNIEIVGPILFQSSSIEMPKLPESSVAVFDVQPHRDSRYQILGALEEYYIPKVTNQFLLDVYTVIHECGGVMAHKRKRNIGRMLHPKYEALVKFISLADNVYSIEPNISAIRVIEPCAAVISMPFTSTALLGRELGKPSIFYDPFGSVQKDDRAAHGIQILCGKEELRNWLIGLLESAGKVFIRGNV